MLLSMLSKRSIRSDVCLVSPKLQNKLSAMSLPATLQVSELKREEYSARILEQACWIWDIIDSIAGFESVFEVWSWMAQRSSGRSREGSFFGVQVLKEEKLERLYLSPPCPSFRGMVCPSISSTISNALCPLLVTSSPSTISSKIRLSPSSPCDSTSWLWQICTSFICGISCSISSVGMNQFCSSFSSAERVWRE